MNLFYFCLSVLAACCLWFWFSPSCWSKSWTVHDPLHSLHGDLHRGKFMILQLLFVVIFSVEWLWPLGFLHGNICDEKFTYDHLGSLQDDLHCEMFYNTLGLLLGDLFCAKLWFLGTLHGDLHCGMFCEDHSLWILAAWRGLPQVTHRWNCPF